MSLVSFIFFFLLFPCSGAKNTSVVNSDENIYEFCPPTKCSKNGPKIRFPFRLKSQSISCGLEGFEVSCPNDKTMLHLPFSSGYYVEDISYLDRSITIMDMHDTTCLTQSLLSLNLTNSRFSLLGGTNWTSTLWNCTMMFTWTSTPNFWEIGPIDCMSSERNFVYATLDVISPTMPPSCRRYKTVNISIDDWYQNNQTKKIVVEWEDLDGCYDCEKLGNYCGFNTTSNSTICFINQQNSKEQSVVSMTAARGTTGYIAPELFSRHFGEVSYKSDVFSYGMMLLEIVGCRKNIDLTIDKESQIYFPEWIYNKMIQGKELNLEIEVEGDEEIAKKLAIVGLWCIQWNPTERPSMPLVLQMLEGDLQSLEIPPKPFASSDDEMDAN